MARCTTVIGSASFASRATAMVHPDGLSASLRAANGSSTALAATGALSDGDSGREGIRKLRDKVARQARQFAALQRSAHARRARLRAASMSARVGRGQDRRRIGHRGAQIGIVPSLDPPGRQSGRGEPRKGGGASRRRLASFLLRELPGERPFGGRSIDDMRGHRRITQPPPRNRDNHCARAQAQVQGRRSRQSGPWPSRARHPA